MNAQQEIELAESKGFTAKPDRARGGNWCSFSKGEIRVWQVVRKGIQWARAHLVDGSFMGHSYHDELADALDGIVTETFRVEVTAVGPEDDIEKAIESYIKYMNRVCEKMHNVKFVDIKRD